MNEIAFVTVEEALHAKKNYVVLVAEGECILEWESGKTEFKTGEIAVIPPLVKYSVHGRVLCVGLERALLPFKQIRIISDDKNFGVAYAARQALEYFSAENSTRDGILAALGSLIVAYVTAFAGGGRLSPVVIGVRDEIQKNLSTPSFSLEDSIKKLPLNYDYVRKLFKKEMGITPHDYLLNCRMQLARELVASGIGNRYSNYSVSQLAEACGFSEPLYFSRVFKKYYGFSPSAARAVWTDEK